MIQIRVLNQISPKGLGLFPQQHYQLSEQVTNPDALLLRSHQLLPEEIADSTLAIGRAGAGVNNIPVDYCTERGIPVLNTPGANANAVKEMVIAGMLLGARHICQSWDYAKQEQDQAAYEKAKNQFVGFELAQKTLGVIGLGNVGVKVANAAIGLNMKVIGFDAQITAQNAWKISSEVERAHSLLEVIQAADFISVHVPLNEETRDLFNAPLFKAMNPNVILLNFARAGIIAEDALVQALEQKQIQAYISDFPSPKLQHYPNVICLPHIGASTIQAQENCALMIAQQLMDYLENGNITYSVNFPEIMMPHSTGHRVSIVNKNVPNMLAQISSTIAEHRLNIIDMLNKSKGDIAYTLLDADAPIPADIIKQLGQIDGVISVRAIEQGTS